MRCFRQSFQLARRSMRQRLCAERYASDPAGSRGGLQFSVSETLVESARLKAVRIQPCPSTTTGFRFLLCLKQHLSSETGASQRFGDERRSICKWAKFVSPHKPPKIPPGFRIGEDNHQGSIIFGLTGPSVVKIDQRTDDCLPHVRPGVSVMVIVGCRAPPTREFSFLRFHTTTKHRS